VNKHRGQHEIPKYTQIHTNIAKMYPNIAKIYPNIAQIYQNIPKYSMYTPLKLYILFFLNNTMDEISTKLYPKK
jgi:hypothetical protein